MPQQIWRRVSKATGRISYQVKIEVGKKRDGKPKYITKTYAKKKEAEAFKRKVLEERQQGIVTEPTKMTVGEYLDKWLEAAARRRQVDAAAATRSRPLPLSALRSMLGGLRRWIGRLSLPSRVTDWTSYAADNTYEDDERNAKREFVTRAVRASTPGTVLDVVPP